MNCIQTLLTQHLDPQNLLTSRREYTFELPARSGKCECIADPYNRRIKLYSLKANDLDDKSLFSFGDEQDKPLIFSKVTAYALPGQQNHWRELGFRKEGVIRGFFADQGDAHMWAAITDPRRAESAERQHSYDEIVQIAQSKKRLVPELASGFRCSVVTQADIPELTELLQATFTDYPSPLTEESITRHIAEKQNHFRIIRAADGSIAAAASGEIDHRRRSAEMTDCATNPAYRGNGLMTYLLWKLEQDLVALYGVVDLYTLARSCETGMNCVFSKLGYDYTGRLANNCRMPSGWESVNIWCKTAGS